MTRLLHALAVALLLAVGGVLLVPGTADAVGEAAPDFSLRDIDGNSVSLSQFKGKVVLVSFWATWCQPCQVEMPHLQRFYDELKGQGFVVLSISTDDARSASQVKPLIKRNGYTFPVLLDKETAVVSQYNPAKVLPYSVILDRDHRIRAVHQGYSPGDEVQLHAELLAAMGAVPVGGILQSREQGESVP